MTEHEQRTPKPPDPGDPHPPRRKYARPSLVEYGSVTKLTQGTRTVQGDFGQAGFKMACL